MSTFDLLLVEDNEIDYALMNLQLEEISEIDFTVTWVNSFSEGTKEIRNNDYDFYLFDDNLGDGLGIDLLKEARKLGINKPIIILTTLENRERDLSAMVAGADDYIQKSQLENTLERSLRYSYEKYNAKKALTQKEERYRNLFERSIDAILIVDDQFVITEVNQAMTNLFSCTVKKVVRKPLELLFLEKEKYKNFQQLIKEKGLLKRKSFILKTCEDDIINASITTIVLYNVQKQIIGYQIIIKDVTKEKRHEQQLIIAEKLSLTGRMARSIAHEVRNPLTNINLAMAHLKETFKNDTDETYFEIIHRSSNRINHLITELLNSSKQSNLEIKSTSLSLLVEEAISLASDRINLREIKLKQEINSKEEINADSVQLKTAILNILINATEAIEGKNGLISVSISSSLDENHITIQDNGKGIPEGTLKQLFDPFFSRKKEGMGLGLTSTQNIIQQHGGSIDVESIEKKGTTFIINLPKLNKHN